MPIIMGCLHLIFQSIQNFPIYVAPMPTICSREREHKERKTMIDSFRETGDIFESRTEGINIIVADDRTGRGYCKVFDRRAFNV